MIRLLHMLASLSLGFGLISASVAQEFPSSPVKVLVGLPPGSAPDLAARALQSGLGQAWNQPLLVENRPGAAGVVATAAVAKSSKDGHTLLLHGAYAVNAVFSQNLGYDPLNDLVVVAAIARQPFVLLTPASSSANSFAEFVAWAKTRPGQLNYGSPGIGSYPHLGGERLKLVTDIQAVHVPLKGPVEVITELLAGRIDFAWSPLTVALPQLQAGKLRALVISGDARSTRLPGLPTLAEVGHADSSFALTLGLWAPAGTPTRTIDTIATAVARELANPTVQESLSRLGGEALRMTPAEFDRLTRKEINDLRQIIAAAKLTPQ